MTDTRQTSRQLLLGIGMGQFNATQTIPYLMMSPATIDPKAPASILLLRHMQRILFQMGAQDVADTGYLDTATADALRQIAGPNWERLTWGAVVSALLAARARGQMLARVEAAASPDGVPLAVSGPLDFLPDVPGGLVTYGVGAYLLYRLLRRRR